MLCGPVYTSKLEGMIQDMNLGSEVDWLFKENVKDLAVQASIKVLTLGYWPPQ